MENELPKRKPLRLKNFDYNTPGAYFITICTKDRKATLSRVVGAIHESPESELTEQGKIVDETINHLPSHLSARIDRFVIMPNHVHRLVGVTDSDELRAIRESPLQSRSVIPKTVGYLKMKVSKEIHTKYGNATVWQRGFHDHLIRNRDDYEKISKTIYENPLKWQYDCFYTEE